MQRLTADCPSNVIADQFLAILPRLRSQFYHAFRRFQPEQKEETLDEATANAFAAFVRLWNRGRQHVAKPTPLAQYAIAQWFAGRRVGTAINGQDVSSPYAQRKHRITLQRIDHCNAEEESWREAALEDRKTPVPDQAAFRIDFPEWLRQLSRRDRKIALQLARGATTSEVAERFQLTWGRVSQLRREFRESWGEFHGDQDDADATA